MRILFAGTPALTLPCLENIYKNHELVAVLTAAPSPMGRSGTLQASAVATWAAENSVPVYAPEKLDAELRQELSTLKAELLVCFAYGKIFGPKFLALFPQGGINIHPSLLPQLRGPSPISSAIAQGLETSGISIQVLAQEMDAGDILYQKQWPLGAREDSESLGDFYAEESALMLQKVLEDFPSFYEHRSVQDGNKASYCTIVKKNDGLADWKKSAVSLDNLARAYTPWPRLFTHWRGLQLNILRAIPCTNEDLSIPLGTEPGTVLGIDKKMGILVQTGDGILALRELQLQGKKAMDHISFMNGMREFVGTRLGVDNG